jgi:hypothetical protein
MGTLELFLETSFKALCAAGTSAAGAAGGTAEAASTSAGTSATSDEVAGTAAVAAGGGSSPPQVQDAVETEKLAVARAARNDARAAAPDPEAMLYSP